MIRTLPQQQHEQGHNGQNRQRRAGLQETSSPASSAPAERTGALILAAAAARAHPVTLAVHAAANVTGPSSSSRPRCFSVWNFPHTSAELGP